MSISVPVATNSCYAHDLVAVHAANSFCGHDLFTTTVGAGRDVLTTIVSKVSNFISTAFQSLSKFTAAVGTYTSNAIVHGANLIQANPHFVLGTLALTAILGAVAYVYSQRSVAVVAPHFHLRT